MQKVAVIIVNWNGKDDTVNCLTTIKQIKHPAYILDVIVVDNGSTNDSVEVIRKKHPWVTIHETHRNLGFTGGTNAGIKLALERQADYFWLLNNDTLVEKNILNILADFTKPKVGIISPKIYFAAGHEYHHDRYQEIERGKVFWYAGGIIDWENMYASHRGVDEVDHGQYDKIQDSPFISGCSMMISREAVKRIGLFDDRFYLYLEDLDYCQRAKRAGFRLLYDPRGVIWHVNAGSSGGAGNPLHEYYLTRNRYLIGLRYAPIRTKLALFREALRFLINGSPIKRKAIKDFVLGRWGNQYEPKKFES